MATTKSRKTAKKPAHASGKAPASHKSATKKAAKKTAKSSSSKSQKAVKKPGAKKPGAKAAGAGAVHRGATKPVVPPKTVNASTQGDSGGGNGAGAVQGTLRVRMYRVGFGDFFLLTVPTNSGPAHILIDCGVHAGNIGTIDGCVADLITETGSKLALIIATHYHADHLSGFATHYDDFKKFEVGMVWITNRLDPGNPAAAQLHMQITSVATQLQLRLAARSDQKDTDVAQAIDKVNNALGIELGAASRAGANGGNGGGGSNAKALELLRGGFSNNAPVRYYQGGDDPELPEVLQGAITAQLLAPAPKDSNGTYAATDDKKEQYLAAAGTDGGFPNTGVFKPFEKSWPGSADDYPPSVFNGYDAPKDQNGNPIKVGGKVIKSGSPAALEAVIKASQPDTMLAMADALDGTVNNQSLVVLFTCQGKKLLFVGDAQWGNWSYWLYGKQVTAAAPALSDTASQILGSIDFYKVGHHGSTNANPIPVIAAINQECVAMCSTQPGCYGKVSNNSEVPRGKLMVALEERIDNNLVRSDWIKVGNNAPSPDALDELKSLPKNFSTGPDYIDYTFPS